MYYKLDDIKNNLENISTTDLHHFLLENDNLSQKYIDLICGELANRGDGYYIYWTAKKNKNVNISILQKGLLKSDKIEYVQAFIDDIKGFSYEQFYNDLLENKDGYLLSKFYQEIEGLDVKTVEDIAIKIGNEGSLLSFIGLEGFDFNRFHEAIINSDCADAIFTLAMLHYKNGVDISRLEDRLIELEETGYIVDFATYVPGANVEKLYDAILSTNDFHSWIDFAIGVKSIDINKAQDKIMNLKNISAIVRFAKDVKGANIEALENIVVNSKDLEGIADFLLLVENANRERLIKEIVNSKDYDFIENIAIELKDDDYKMLMNYYKCLVGRRNIKDIKKRIDEERKSFELAMSTIDFVTNIINNLNKR